jgi:hypothetical protein
MQLPIIPDKNLFIVTSAVKPVIGVFDHDERFEQTITSLKSIRNKVPDAIILLVDCSVSTLTHDEKKLLTENSNIFLNLSSEPNCAHFSKTGMKSHAENAMLFFTLQTLKNNKDISNLLNTVKRIFKFSARSELDDTFDITEYDNLFGKFVFKDRLPTWMSNVQHGADHLFITRMFSFCPSLIDTYLQVIQKNMQVLDTLDTEHAHFVNIPKDNLVEFVMIHCHGWLAGNGEIEYY